MRNYIRKIFASFLSIIIIFSYNTVAFAQGTLVKNGYGVSSNAGEVIQCGKLTDVELASYKGIGSLTSPYIIIFKNGTFTAPFHFWGSMSSANKNDLNVIFEKRENDLTTNKVLYSYKFKKQDKRHNGIYNGQVIQEPWDNIAVYSFRFSPTTGIDTSTGQLRFAHSWKGKYDLYWNDWEYRLNVTSLTSKLTADKQIKPGDKIKVTYYGNYQEGQTNKGTDYSIDFNKTDNKVDWSRELTVDSSGFAVFKGNNHIQCGGNYKVEKITTSSVEAKPNFLANAQSQDLFSGQLKSPETSSYAGNGSKLNPYIILRNEKNKFTAPSKFWEKMYSEPEQDFNVIFENRENNEQSGKLISSYKFNKDKKVDAQWKDFEAVRTNSFRFCFVTETDIKDGNLRFAHAWKGKYDFYWKDWEYKLNVSYLTSKLPEEKQVKPGDEIKVSYYGNFNEDQTSKGTDYTVDLNKIDKNANWSRNLTVDKNGFAVFSGENFIQFGGNFKVEKVAVTPKPPVPKPPTPTEDDTPKGNGVITVLPIGSMVGAGVGTVGGEGGGPKAPLRLEQSSIKSGSYNVPLNPRITMRFTKNVGDAVVRENNASAIRLVEKPSNKEVKSYKIGFSNEFDDRQFIQVLADNLQEEKTYAVLISENIKARNGINTLAKEEEIIFTTKGKESVENPTITPNKAVFEKTQKVEISTETDGAIIYYTTDESIPTESSTKYEKPFEINKDTTIKAIAVKDGMKNSEVVSKEYTKKEDEVTTTPTVDKSTSSTTQKSRPKHKSKFNDWFSSIFNKNNSVENPIPSINKNEAISFAQKAAESSVIEAKNKGSKPEKIVVKLKNVEKIKPETFKTIADTADVRNDNEVLVYMDCVKDRKVTARMYINAKQASKLDEPINTIIKTNESFKDNVKTENTFNKFFDNNVKVVSFEQKGDFGMDITSAVKIDLDGLNTKNLKFYSYKTDKNTYKEIKDTDYFIDVNGYLHFNTDRGYTMVITDSILKQI